MIIKTKHNIEDSVSFIFNGKTLTGTIIGIVTLTNLNKNSLIEYNIYNPVNKPDILTIIEKNINAKL